MIEVKLYAPDKVDATINFPECWDELYSEEVLLIAKQIVNVSNDKSTQALILTSILRLRAKLQKIKLPKGWEKLIDLEDLVINGLPLLQFIFGDNTLSKLPESTITVTGTRDIVLYGPENGFQSITCGEFEAAEIIFNDYIESQDFKKLAELAAIFYRQKNQKFQSKLNSGQLDTYNFEKWSKLFEKIEPHRLYAIYIWYVGCKNQLPELFPVAHEPSGDDSTEPQNPAMAFTRCIHAGAGPKNGTRQDIRLTPIWEFFFDMEQNAIQAKNQQKLIEK